MPRGKPGTITHGHSGYVHGCKCWTCYEGHRAEARASYRRRVGMRDPATGEFYARIPPREQAPGLADAAPYCRLFRRMYEAGIRQTDMIAVTGLSEYTVEQLVHGRVATIWHSTAVKARRVVSLLP